MTHFMLFDAIVLWNGRYFTRAFLKFHDILCYPIGLLSIKPVQIRFPQERGPKAALLHIRDVREMYFVMI